MTKYVFATAALVLAALTGGVARAQTQVQLTFDVDDISFSTVDPDPAGLVGASVTLLAEFGSAATWTQPEPGQLLASTSSASITIAGASNSASNGTFAFDDGLQYVLSLGSGALRGGPGGGGPSGGWTGSDTSLRPVITIPVGNVNLTFDMLPNMLPGVGDAITPAQFDGVNPAAVGLTGFYADDLVVYSVANTAVIATPEPTSLVLLALGGLGLLRRR